jgi:RND superfamily putative drug exporter
VFASFSFGGERIVSAIGIGLGAAVLIDAFVVRLTLVPALMRLIGERNWAYPRWAERVTPHLSVEGSAADGIAVGGTAVGGTAVGGTAVGGTAVDLTAVELLASDVAASATVPGVART